MIGVGVGGSDLALRVHSSLSDGTGVAEKSESLPDGDGGNGGGSVSSWSTE